MRYTVVWAPAALNQLAELWVEAADQQAVTDSADRIDMVLHVDPDNIAIPMGRFYMYVDDPLAALFEISPDDCLVQVTMIRRTAT